MRDKDSDYYVGSWSSKNNATPDQWKVKTSNSDKAEVDVENHEATVPDTSTAARRATRLYEGLRAMQGEQQFQNDAAKSLEETRLSALADRSGLDVRDRFNDPTAAATPVGPRAKPAEVVESWSNTVGAACSSASIAAGAPEVDAKAPQSVVKAFQAADAAASPAMRDALRTAAQQIWQKPDAATRDQAAGAITQLLQHPEQQQQQGKNGKQSQEAQGGDGKQQSGAESSGSSAEGQQNQGQQQTDGKQQGGQQQSGAQQGQEGQQQGSGTQQAQGNGGERQGEQKEGQQKDGNQNGSKQKDGGGKKSLFKKVIDFFKFGHGKKDKGADGKGQQQGRQANANPAPQPQQYKTSQVSAPDVNNQVNVASELRRLGGVGSLNKGQVAMDVHYHINRTHQSHAMRRPEGAVDVGTVPVHWERWASDKQIFQSTRPGGTILIDCSGSMDWDFDKLRESLAEFPAMKIAVYAGTGGSHGKLCIIADNGRWSDLDADQASRGGNDIDLEAVTWLAGQPGPRVWLSDGFICGGRVAELGGQRSAQILRGMANAKHIARAESVDAALGYLKAHGARKTKGVVLGRDPDFIPREHLSSSGYGIGW